MSATYSQPVVAWQPTSASGDEHVWLFPPLEDQSHTNSPQVAQMPQVRRRFLETLSTVALYLNSTTHETTIVDEIIHRKIIEPTSAVYSAEALVLIDAELASEISEPGHPKVIAGRDVRRLVDDLVEWLGITRGDVASIGGFSRRNISNWVTRGAYPKTVRHILAVHSFVSSLVRHLGLDGARHWILENAGGQATDNASVVAMLGDHQRIAELVSAASSLLFAAPRRRSQLEMLSEEDEIDALGAANSEFKSNAEQRTRQPQTPIKLAPKPARRR
jgi:hypothetical protein